MGFKGFFIIGVVLVFILAPLHALVPDPYAVELLAVISGLMGGVYAGIGIASGQKVMTQIMVSLLFVICGLLGLWVNPLFFALAFFAHGIWDIITVHPKCLKIKVVKWYMPMCVGYDFLFALYIAYWHLYGF